ncbi:hypothetical protein QQF64_009185, partial [Cirrhinus molitorella]
MSKAFLLRCWRRSHINYWLPPQGKKVFFRACGGCWCQTPSRASLFPAVLKYSFRAQTREIRKSIALELRALDAGAMMKFAWDNYKQYAWGKNELRPLTRNGHIGNMF